LVTHKLQLKSNVKTRGNALILIWLGNSQAAIEINVKTRGTALILIWFGTHVLHLKSMLKRAALH
jgi:hypothetical protein